MDKTNIVIIGSGWYGLHIALLLQDKYNVTILEKQNEIFNGASNYNQNRLHIGYHYPRNSNTRNLCSNNYTRFIKKYRDVIDFIDNNYYCISKDSLIDYETYLQIYNTSKYDHKIIKNTFLENIDGDFINTKEKIINAEKAKQHFLNNIKCKVLTNYTVSSIKHKNDKVIINDDITCDFVFDCTYNQLELSKKSYIYEMTVSLLYERINHDKLYDSITVMDGNFFSLFPREINKEIYSLTHVKYTPVFNKNTFNELTTEVITDEKIEEIKENITKDVLKYYKDFHKDYKYKSFFSSYKCKILSSNASRECNIEKKKNIVSVNCGKITGIFMVEDYILNILKL